MRAIGDRLSYANVTATLALFLALGGVAWAAGLPRNSVGSTQLKRNAVTGAKVRNGTLTKADLKAGTLTAGPAGPKGDTGAQGPKGDTGPIGPSDAYTALKGSGLLAIGAGFTPIVTTPQLPAGSYVLAGRANVIGTTAGTNSFICSMADDAAQNFQVANGAMLPLSMASTIMLTVPGTVSLSCLRNSGGGQVAQAQIIATKVATITGP